MLRRLLPLPAVLALVAGLLAVTASAPAQADGCTKNPLTGQCVITSPGPTDPGQHQPGPTPVENQVCMYQGKEIPCVDSKGNYWDSAHQCYPASAPDWANSGVSGVDPHTGEQGGYYWCIPPGVYGPFIPIWFPGGPPKVNPAVLARALLAKINFAAIDVGIVPEDKPGSEGLVGMPVWMWVQNPTPTTYGPLTDSDSAGGVTVTLTANVTKVEWDMGDGSAPVICGEGTPYADSYGRQDSPDCGYHYKAAGSYTVHATSYWTIDWTGGGQNGAFHLTFTRDAPVRIAEMQVLNQS